MAGFKNKDLAKRAGSIGGQHSKRGKGRDKYIVEVCGNKEYFSNNKEAMKYYRDQQNRGKQPIIRLAEPFIEAEIKW